jgi:cyclopropane-fatty-acyl-phospholipid synthase
MSYMNSLVSYIGSSVWPSLVAACRRAVMEHLNKIQIGTLIITEPDGSSTICGTPCDEPEKASSGSKSKCRERSVYDVAHAELTVVNDLFWVRVALFADMGFAESFMLGEFDCSDLTSFFKVFIANRECLSEVSTSWISSIRTKLGHAVRKTNTLANARLHIAAHYDISNDMFAAFLSPDMTYSCAIFQSRHAPEVETLEEAQHRKLSIVIANARITSSDHVLEIGTGWGSFAILAVERTGCRVTSLTLSSEQKTLAEQRIKAAGFESRIQVLLCDYRSLPVPKNEEDKYDKIVSIEMLEAVGAEYLSTYFQCVDDLLKTDGGIGVFQCITIPESRYEGYRRSDDFIRRYIFPGGHLPTTTQLLESIRSGSSGLHPPRLIPESVSNVGPHYARTLRLWSERFLANFDEMIKPALLAKHDNSSMSDEDVQVFRRKWIYYFSYCEAGFATKTLGDAIITVGREGTLQMMEDVPL